MFDRRGASTGAECVGSRDDQAAEESPNVALDETSGSDFDVADGHNAVQPTASLSRRSALGVVAAGAFLTACSSRQEELVASQGQRQSSAGTASTTTAPLSAEPVVPAVLRVELDAETMAANEMLASVELDTPGMTDILHDPVGSAAWSQRAETEGSPDEMNVVVVDPSMASEDPVMSSEESTQPARTPAESTQPAASSEESTQPARTPEESTQPAASSEESTQPARTPEESTQPIVPVTPFKSTSSSLTAALVVNKLTFGPTPGLITKVEAMGPQAFIQDQLSRTRPDPEVDKRVADIKPIVWTPRESKENGVRTWWTSQYVTHAATCRAVHSQSQLYEMMCHLWMDHFCVFLTDEWARSLARYQEKTIRPHAMGKFKDMLKATAHDVAMLGYLDNIANDASTPDGINENYGRELLELHTLGIDRDGRQIYNEQDVRNAAAVMGGWGTGEHWSDFAYNPGAAYQGPDLSILGGAWSTAGKSGKARGDSLLEFLATHPSTALNIALRICRRFVSDNPSQSLLDSTAKVFLQNDTAIVPTLQHVLESEEFATSGGLKLRRPFEFHVALWRALDTKIPTKDYESKVNNDVLALMWYQHSVNAQRPWSWQQPTGYPDDADYWVTTDLFATRWRDAFGLANGGSRRWGASPEFVYQAAKASVATSDPTATELVQAMAKELGIGPLTSKDATVIAAEPKWQNQVPLLLCHPRFQNR